ncbi:MAG: tetratricopeptide repeat protein [Planctomycetota bacterium]
MWWKRVILVLAGPLLAIGFLELVARLTGLGRYPHFLVECRAPDATARLMVNPQSPWGDLPFEPASFTLQKPPGVHRIFCLGESTVNGTPFAGHCSFSKWLRLRFSELLPDQLFEVVKMGVNGRNSRDIARLCREVVAYDPDVIVVYTGHNEFLTEHLPAVRSHRAERLRETVMSLRVARLAASLLGSPATAAAVEMRNPVRIIHDEAFLCPSEHDNAYRSYRRGIEDIVACCRAAGVALVLCQPVSNLRDCEPRWSHLDERLTSEQRAAFRAAYDAGTEELAQRRHGTALARFNEARAIDATPALLYYRIAQCYQELGDIEAARAALIEARDRDNHPTRATSRHCRIIEEVAGTDTLVADCRVFFARASPSGLPGNDLFIDDCHPRIDAQNLIAEAVLRTLAHAGLFAPEESWRFAQEPSLDEYHRRLQLNLAPLATDTATYVIRNLLLVASTAAAGDSLERARFLLRFAHECDPSNATAHLGLALVAVLDGDRETAELHVERSQEADPGVLAGLRALARTDEQAAALLARLPPLAGAER